MDNYKHLVSFNTGRNRHELESRVRTAHAWSAFNPLKKNVFKEKGIYLPLRLQAWKSLCASRLLFHCATWGHMSSVPLRNLSNCYHSSHRQLLTRSKQEGHRTNEGVRADAQVLSLQHFTTAHLGSMDSYKRRMTDLQAGRSYYAVTVLA